MRHMPHCWGRENLSGGWEQTWVVKIFVQKVRCLEKTLGDTVLNGLVMRPSLTSVRQSHLTLRVQEHLSGKPAAHEHISSCKDCHTCSANTILSSFKQTHISTVKKGHGKVQAKINNSSYDVYICIIITSLSFLICLNCFKCNNLI